MKLFTNLPRTLKTVFDFLRYFTVIPVILTIFNLAFAPWLKAHLFMGDRLMIPIGQMALPAGESELKHKADLSKPAPLEIDAVRGIMKMDFLNLDTSGRVALWKTLLPAKLLLGLFGWTLFGLLSGICANISSGNVFSLRNVSLVKWLGFTLIAYSLIGSVIERWASYVMSGYLNAHFALVTENATEMLTGSLYAFQLTRGSNLLSGSSELVVGCLVLVMAEVFRQGLALKTENELTV